MTIDVLTLFPEMFTGVISSSIIKRAIDDKKVTINLHNFRDFSKDIHHKVDDTPYGGGCGMILACQPIFDCVNSLRRENSKVILLTPDGTVYNQEIAGSLSKEEHLILICGHYEGFDERIRSICDMELSIGDYVLTGGEVPAMVLIDSVTRLLDGVINKESYENDSFYQGLLDYPQYTKPRVYNGLEVPEVLLSGNHQKIAEFRKVQALERTKLRRPDLLKGDINNGNL
jgi:tRNA (guanine37-N1)-methyltransferase